MKKIVKSFMLMIAIYLISNSNAVALTQTITNQLPDTTGIIQGVKCSGSGENRVCNPTSAVTDPDSIVGYLSGNFHTSIKFDDNGVLFCTKHEEVSPTDGSTKCTKNVGNWDTGISAGVAAIISHVTPDWSATKITDSYMLVTYSINQFLFDNGVGGEDVKTKYPLVSYNDKVTEYLTKAEEAKENATNPTITLSTNKLEFTKKDGKYVSNLVTVNSNVASYSITSTEGVAINRDGNTFSVSLDENDARFVGAPLKVDVSVTAQKSILQARNYNCGSYQSLTPANYETLTLTETATISGEIKINTSLTIKKVDENNKILPGVELKIESTENEFSKTITTTEEAIVIEDLKFGKYVITEISSPSGYVKLKNPVEITIDSENLKVEKVIKNSLTRVEIEKLSSENSELLAGAVLQIQDAEGNVLKDKSGKKYEWETTNKAYVIEGLIPGKYYLVELSAPEGYVLNENKVEFVVDDTTEVVKVQLKNDIEVKVPDTLSSRSALLITISMIDIFLGIGIVTYVKKNKVKE